MTTLYEMTDELAAAQRDLFEMMGNNVISDEEYNDSLSAMLDQHQVKVSGVIAHIKSEDSAAAMFNDEAAKHTKKAKAASKRAEFYRGYLLAQLIKLDQTEAGEGVHTCKIKKGSMRLNVIDIDDIPRLYIREETKYTPDKAWMTREIKAGKTIEGAELVAGPSTLKIV